MLKHAFDRTTRTALLGIVLCAACALKAETQSQPLVADKEAGEVRVSAKFVNPSQVIEVFACDPTGPRHETVLEFDVKGKALTQALLDIGCRGASYWNGTGPDAFEQNQGDRVLVLVRWEHQGEKHEHPAEGILTDGESGFPLCVRGFSFGAKGAFKVDIKKDEGEDGDKETVGDSEGDDGVEITLGAAVRQTRPRPIVAHPTCSKRMQPWMLSPFLDRNVVKDHRELVEKAVPVTLILRRIRTEVELVEQARRTARARGLAGADALYDRILPMAREIDALKAEYESLLAELKRLVGQAGSPEAAGQVREKVLRGSWICARVGELYLAQYGEEEEAKAVWVSRQTEVPQELRQQTIDLVRSGFRYEPLLAGKRTALAALELPSFQGTPGEANLRRHLLATETEELELDRARALTLSNIGYIKMRLEEARDDAYLRRLFEEDHLRHLAVSRQLEAKLKLARTEREEISGLLDGSWESKKARVLRDRKQAEADLERAKKEEARAQLLQDIRYAESDLESRDPDRKSGAEPRLKDLREKLARLEAELKTSVTE